MSPWLSFYRSTIGKKVIAALTGLLMMGFLVVHMAGNFKVFLPDPEPGVADIDVYARFLRSMGEPLLPHESALWIARLVLLAALLLHVTCVSQLALRNRRARPASYARHRLAVATPAARWMLVSGGLLLIFVVVHLLHFTTGSLDPQHFQPGAVYANLHAAFSHWGFAAFYAAAMVVLGLHLYHGGWSLFQTLGIDNPDRNAFLRTTAAALALAVALGFAAIPISIALGILPEPRTTTPAELPGAPQGR